LPCYPAFLGEIVWWNKERKKYVLRRVKGFLREMIGYDEGVAELDSGSDDGQMAGTVTGSCAVI
jgi:hypothetical protein